MDLITTVIYILLYLVGIVSVVMIIMSGIKITTGSGNPEVVRKARITLICSIIGLVVALVLYAIINFPHYPPMS